MTAPKVFWKVEWGDAGAKVVVAGRLSDGRMYGVSMPVAQFDRHVAKKAILGYMRDAV